MIKAVLFDLDGTLVDTAQDLGNALNRLLNEYSMPPIPQTLIRPYVSGGSPALLKLGFGIDINSSEFEALKFKFLNYYQDELYCFSKLFEGVNIALDFLDANRLPWGIVTNKPGFLTTPLLKALGLEERSWITISGDTYPKRKPDPMPLIEAAKHLKITPQETAYFGDDERDILAAHAAEMISVSVGWGYPGDKDPQSWQARHFIAQSNALIDFLRGHFIG